MNLTDSVVPSASRWTTARIAELTDWSKSPLGPVDGWPAHLIWSARIVLSSSFPMVLLWGRELAQIYNAAYRDTFMGDRHPAGMGQSNRECWPEVWHFNEPIYERVFRHEKVFLEDQHYVVNGGAGPRVHFITLSFDPLETDAGEVEGIVVSLLDVTRRVIAERENKVLLDNAQEAASTLRDWFDQAPGFTALLTGPDYTFELANKAYSQLIGHREVIGKPVFEALPEMRSQGFRDLLDQVRTTGEAFIGRGQALDVQREVAGPLVQVVVDFVYQPVRNRSGEVVGVFVQGHEVTEQHRAVEALQQAQRHKDEFLATLAHELRNPLAPIRQAAMIARSTNATGAQRQWSLDMIERQVQHLSLLLDDLMDVARVSSGLLHLRKERIDLSAAIHAAIESAQPSIAAKEHRVDFAPAPAPLWVEADPLRLDQILANLLSNAVKYTDRQGSIVVETAVDQGFVQVRVRDDGVGLEAGNLEKIFIMFTQVNSALERSEGGLGIGLALSRGLAQLHGGTLTVSSQGLGKGTEFLLRLPQAPIKGQDVSAVQVPAAASSSRWDVLLVDDNVDAVESLATMLELQGHSVRWVTSGAAALQLAQHNPPEIAIVDIGMPEMNGYEVATKFRSAAWGKDVTLIALTGWGQPEDRQQALVAGFDHHFTKPVQIDQLLAVLGPRD